MYIRCSIKWVSQKTAQEALVTGIRMQQKFANQLGYQTERKCRLERDVFIVWT